MVVLLCCWLELVAGALTVLVAVKKVSRACGSTAGVQEGVARVWLDAGGLRDAGAR